MLPGPSGMRRRALPRSLLQMRLRQALPAIVVLRRAALAVVGSHPSPRDARLDSPDPIPLLSPPSVPAIARIYLVGEIFLSSRLPDFLAS